MVSIRLLSLVFLLALATPSLALKVDGMQFDDQIQLAGAPLRLNGVGFRAEVFIKGYAAALYLGQKATTAAQAVAATGPKRLQMRMLLDVSTEEFVKAIHKGMRRNLKPEELTALDERLAQFDRMLRSVGDVKKGDVIDLDWLPAQGLIVAVNGKRRGEPIAGADFYAALLLTFVGARPYDRELKAGLLGGPAQ